MKIFYIYGFGVFCCERWNCFRESRNAFYERGSIIRSKSILWFQIAMENIHSEVYSLLIDTYIKDREEKDKFFNGLNNFDCIRKKGTWAQNGSMTKEVVSQPD